MRSQLRHTAVECSFVHSLAAHERLTISAARYSEGSFLDEHTDAPSGSESYNRVRAFVLHLSKGFTSEDGGLFKDLETGILLHGLPSGGLTVWTRCRVRTKLEYPGDNLSLTRREGLLQLILHSA